MDIYQQFNEAAAELNGDTTSQEKAVNTIKQLADNGFTAAQHAMGLMHYKGLHGVKTNYSKALDWFKLSAEKGNHESMLQIGLICLEADASGANEKAAELFLMSANLGNKVAQNNLGFLYLRGRGVEENKETAFEWFAKSAKQGYVDAQDTLGTMYWKGEGTEKDLEQAFYWFREATLKGHHQAAISLSMVSYEKADHNAPHFKAYQQYLDSDRSEDMDIPIGDYKHYNDEM